ncbi:MAG: phosphoglucosamine mutase [Planctomycetes bacterium]|nr:phosphoglucosamine mutase [Planctomycetota bacterium]
MGKWFGTDGIRGVANTDPMTAEMALKVGRAVAFACRRAERRPRVVVGRDPRISGDALEHALVAGICSMGADACRVGILPTPGVAFLVRDLDADAGIVLSASHNPFPDNGIKLFSSAGRKLPDAREAEIEALILEARPGQNLPTGERLGRAVSVADAENRYVDFLKRTWPRDLSLEGLKVAMDCANGATYRVGPRTFAELGAVVAALGIGPDGTNINRDCGSEHVEPLARRVIEEGAALGLAFDGDGDRLIAVDERGGIVTGDRILALAARALETEGRLRNGVVVSTVMSNLGLRSALRVAGIRHVATPVGDRYVRDAMDETGAILGGEDSGHLIFGEHHTTGDGILSALQLAAILRRTGRLLSELAAVMTVYPQHLVNVDVRAKPELDAVPAIAAAIAAAEASLGEHGRVLVRYSGTQPLCRVMVEGPTAEITAETCRRIAAVVARELG